MDADEYRGANNRAYYAIFHAINAIHALDGNGYKRHKDAIANFNKQYVKTEIFPREIGRKISKAEEIRHASDYDDFYIASKEKAEEKSVQAEYQDRHNEAFPPKSNIPEYAELHHYLHRYILRKRNNLFQPCDEAPASQLSGHNNRQYDLQVPVHSENADGN